MNGKIALASFRLRSRVPARLQAKLTAALALFCWLFVSSVSSAANTSNVKAPHSKPKASPLEQAREMVLKGEKPEALSFLSKAYKANGFEAPMKSAQRIEFLKTWEEIANLFLTDKAQNHFSLAESLWMSRPKEAVEFLQTASQQEPGNLQIAILGARSALRAQDCVRAEAFSKEAEKIFSPGLEVRLVRLQSQLCALRTLPQAPALAIKPLSDAGEPWGEFDSAVRALVVGDHWRRGDVKGAKAAVTAWETQATGDPEMWYWKWKVSDADIDKTDSKGLKTSGRTTVLKDRSAARSYLRICNELTPRRRKNFSMHPELCLWTESVESDLKSGEKQGL